MSDLANDVQRLASNAIRRGESVRQVLVQLRHTWALELREKAELDDAELLQALAGREIASPTA